MSKAHRACSVLVLSVAIFASRLVRVSNFRRWPTRMAPFGVLSVLALGLCPEAWMPSLSAARAAPVATAFPYLVSARMEP